MSLTPKQQRFVAEYLVDYNASAAYQRAGYKASGNVAESAASRLLRNVKVSEEIVKGKEQIAARTAITQDRVLDGMLKEAEREGEGSSHSARVSAWAHLGKHLGIFPDKHELAGSLKVDHEHSLTTEQRRIELLDLLAALRERSGVAANTEPDSIGTGTGGEQP